MSEEGRMKVHLLDGSGVGACMNYHVLTLFPEMIRAGNEYQYHGQGDRTGIYFSESNRTSAIMLRISIIRWMITPYGGGAGMVMQAAPVYRSL